MQKATKIVLGVLAAAVGVGVLVAEHEAKAAPAGNKTTPQNGGSLLTTDQPHGGGVLVPDGFDGSGFSDQGLKNVGNQPVEAPREGDPAGTIARVVDPASGNSVPVDYNGVALGYVDNPGGVVAGKHTNSAPIVSGGAEEGGNFGEEEGSGFGVGSLNPFRPRRHVSRNGVRNPFA